MLTIGLTGGIGSGKSEVARMFHQLGVPVVDADEIAHQLVQPGSPALTDVVAVFGKGILTPAGELDRARLAEIVFNTPELKRQLEAIIHPGVREQIRAFKEMHGHVPYIVVVIPLLLESGQRDLVDRVLVVNTEEAVRIRRVQARDGRSEAQIRAIMENQSGDEERRNAADDSLDNNGTLDELELSVRKLHQQYIALSQQDNFM